MKREIIPVVFAPNENYIIPTCVAILSMLRTKMKETKYKFFIVISNNFKRDYLCYLDQLKMLEEEFDYEVLYIDTKKFDNQKITSRHISVSAYYRLAIADILTGYNKCIYCDGDILVNKDLQDMYHIEMGDNYVAGVKAAELIHRNKEQKIASKKKWGFESCDNYINSGVLVFNLAKIREDDITNRFLDEMKKGYPSEDQDVINICCYGKIKSLPLKYNLLSRWINNNALLLLEPPIFSKDEIEDAKQNPSIIHFAGGRIKPWSNLRETHGDVWWGYVKEILSKSQYLEYYKNAEKVTRERDWEYLRNKLEKERPIIIFGYSDIGKELAKVLLHWGCELKCFIDNDVQKHGQHYNGYEVLDINRALSTYMDVIIIIASQGYKKEIREQLVNKGFAAENIIIYNSKSEVYYLSLAPQFYSYEFGDLCVKEFGWNTD